MAFTIPSLSTRIETARLYLRPYRAEDAEWYAAMSQRNRGHLAQYEADNAAMSIHSPGDAKRVLDEFMTDWTDGRGFFLGAFTRGACTRVGDEFVAQVFVGVRNRDLPEFVIGFFADAKNEGQGYVSEAVRGVLAFLFRDLGAHRVRLECDETNVRSARVAERCGFVREGHNREDHLWPNGSVTGTLLYGLLRREYNL